MDVDKDGKEEESVVVVVVVGGFVVVGVGVNEEEMVRGCMVSAIGFPRSSDGVP